MKHIARLVPLALLGLLLASASYAGTFRVPTGCDPVDDSFVVILKETRQEWLSTSQRAHRLAKTYGGTVTHVFESVFQGFGISVPYAQGPLMATESEVDLVEQNCHGELTSGGGTQIFPPWHLDRVDQPNLPLDAVYQFSNDGAGVNAYVLDSGIRGSHPNFGGRVTAGHSIFGGTTQDCHGHGTHVAGVLGSLSYGVAKGVTLHPVVVVECSGNVDTLMATQGLEWVLKNYQEPAVVNMSLAWQGDPNAPGALVTAVNSTLAAGIPVVAGSGNWTSDTCDYIPAGIPGVITVGATNSADEEAWFSNIGSCVDLLAPGVNILSTCPESLPFCHIHPSCPPAGNDTTYCAGTSQASPHVAGAVARHLQLHPGHTPAQVHDAIVQNATAGVLTTDPTTPNLLLYTEFVGNGAPQPQDEFFSTLWETSFTFTHADLLGNDTDPDGDPLTVCVIQQPTHGTISFSGPGTLVYTPPQGCAVGFDSFQYAACDAVDQTYATADVSISGIICPSSK